MKLRRFLAFGVFLAAVLFSYESVRAQNTTPSATKSKETVTATKAAPQTMPKHTVVVSDPFNKTDATAKDVATTPKTSSTKIGNYSVNVTEGVTGQSFEDGRWLTVTTWDGTKWVSKRTWFPNNKSATPPNNKPNQ